MASEATGNGPRAYVILAAISFFGVLLLRTAWVCDDAYITLRTVDNFIHGFGLRWNVAERVQPYTHPLWLFCLATVCRITREFFYTTLFLSMAVSMAAVIVVAFGHARATANAFLAVMAMAFSKAFLDFSTSGLENPLTHLLLGVYFFVFFRELERNDRPRVFRMALVAGLLALNRLDTMLIAAFPLLYVLYLNRFAWRSFVWTAAGFLPLMLWEMFSLIYYGFPFPNTAYAKLATGIPRSMLIEQGLYYVLNSVSWDPLTLVFIAIGLGASVIHWQRGNGPAMCCVAAGALAYIAYVVSIGGDFMSGRFFAAPMFCAVVIVARTPLQSWRTEAALFSLIFLLGLSAPWPNLTSRENYSELDHPDAFRVQGITDERAFYYGTNGLLTAHRQHKLPSHWWAKEGRKHRKQGTEAIVQVTVGMFGFEAGPNVFVIDALALTEPLLARLPVKDLESWRPGHYPRRFPEGYLDSVSENMIRDPDLSTYWNKLSLVVRGPLWSVDRFKEIWRFNTGEYDHLLDSFRETNDKLAKSETG